MKLWRVVERVRSLFRARRLDHELDGEIAAHLELAERDGIARGLSPDEARRQARVSFGGIEAMREDHRDHRSARWLETFVKDLRYGLASLLRDRGFATVAIGVLALGIGANAAMFSVMDAAFFKPLPFPDPDRIVRPPMGGPNARRPQSDLIRRLPRVETAEYILCLPVGTNCARGHADARWPGDSAVR